ncbi:MAG: UDP-N-acetylglucosamine 2-epimerase (non-hydrolyzing) [Acidimicrobiia bacterium]|nr:UDP-N-acetylglucosamine 2-epimerase (non-hydrolyzing) [Acidimicrobiia bacterium]MCY4456681.1 UDP-N-acetylglucosamine 2-epimerase (non-hydrolyzing) [Acidimicrobiaceae bacterium]
MDILVVIGTRPEAIKMAPLIRRLRGESSVRVNLCATGQHREMFATALEPFEIETDFNLDLMREAQPLADLTAAVLRGLQGILDEIRPDIVLVQGDTSSTFAASLAAFYAGVRVGHVEAGLRTGDPLAPWPEELNRRLTAQVAHWHFAPTETARSNLLAESIAPNRIFVTGNTVIDALEWILSSMGDQLRENIRNRFPFLADDKKLLLATVHRRENQRGGAARVCAALRTLARREDINVLLPVHPNPAIKPVVEEILGSTPRVHLVEPLDYFEFVATMNEAHLIVTDSGGVQEEAPYLGVPVLVTREKTERPEAVAVGAARLVGTDTAEILRQSYMLLDDRDAHEAMASTSSPFGDGLASARIAKVLLNTPR